MPYYIDLFRYLSIASIYVLLAEVLFLYIIRGRINDIELKIFAYIWLPLAVVAQSVMSYLRLTLNISNLPVMNIYLMIELLLFSFILFRIRSKIKSKPINYNIWFLTFIIGIVIHFTYELNSIHTAAIMYTAIVYFNLTIGSIEIEKIEQFYKDFYLLLNLGIFVKAFGYSYFTIYQIDYKFSLAVYSLVNLLVQIIFFITILVYYLSLGKRNIEELNS